MSKLHEWYANYKNEATWWVIGWCSFACIDQLLQGNWVFGILNGVLVYFNYYMWRKDNV